MVIDCDCDCRWVWCVEQYQLIVDWIIDTDSTNAKVYFIFLHKMINSNALCTHTHVQGLTDPDCYWCRPKTVRPWQKSPLFLKAKETENKYSSVLHHLIECL